MIFEIIAFLSIVILFGYREYNNHIERQDLMNRLMSRNFQEFKQLTEEPEDNQIETMVGEVISLEEAREDLTSPGA